jgi:hypothetical protein
MGGEALRLAKILCPSTRGMPGPGNWSEWVGEQGEYGGEKGRGFLRETRNMDNI